MALFWSVLTMLYFTAKSVSDATTILSIVYLIGAFGAGYTAMAIAEKLDKD